MSKKMGLAAIQRGATQWAQTARRNVWIPRPQAGYTVLYGDVRGFATASDSGELSELSEMDIDKIIDRDLDVDLVNPFDITSQYINSTHFYQNTVLKDWAMKQPHAISLRHLAFFGKKLTPAKIISSANFVRTELPIRMAHRIREMQTLPFGLVNNYHMTRVYHILYNSFNNLRKFPHITTLEENDKFCLLLDQLLREHVTSLPHLLIGVLECGLEKYESFPASRLDEFISLALRSRISRRLIAEEHISFSKLFKANPQDQQNRPPDYIGEMFFNCSLYDSLSRCCDIAAKAVKLMYPEEGLPELIIEGDDATFPFMRIHLDYVLGEILRNSYEANVRQNIAKHGRKSGITPGQILICISKDERNIVVRVSDNGGGLEEEKIEEVWSFAKEVGECKRILKGLQDLPGMDELLKPVYNEAQISKHGLDPFKHIKMPLATLGSEGVSSLSSFVLRNPRFRIGLGLPISKVYTDYWNGAISMKSLEGYGCDTVLQLGRPGMDEKNQLDRA